MAKESSGAEAEPSVRQEGLEAVEGRLPGRSALAPASQWRLVWLRFHRHRLGLASGLLLLVIALFLFLGEFVGPYNYGEGHLRFANAPPTQVHLLAEGGLRWPYVCATVARSGGGYGSDCSRRYALRLLVRGEPYRLLGFFPSDVHLFGTGEAGRSPGQVFLFGADWAGRDIFTRTLVGGRTTLLLSLLVVLLSLAVGVPVGGISGYRGGVVDGLIQRAIELIMGVPRLALLLALSLILEVRQVPPEVRLFGIALILAFVSWAPIARVVRGQFLSLRELDFVTSALAVGASEARIILRHILPNVMSTIVVAATLVIPMVIVVESTLSFLGYGVREPLVSWGSLLNVAIQQMVLVLTQYPWNLAPGFFIIVTVLLFNFLGDALRDALDPFIAISEGRG